MQLAYISIVNKDKYFLAFLDLFYMYEYFSKKKSISIQHAHLAYKGQQRTLVSLALGLQMLMSHLVVLGTEL